MFIVVMICTRLASILVGFYTMSGLDEASISLSMDTVLNILLSSTVTISSVTEMALNGRMV